MLTTSEQNPPTSPPQSPSRIGRGLSYLRNYTHHRQSDSRQIPNRDEHSPPLPPSPAVPASPPQPPLASTSAPASILTSANSSNTPSGWFPTLRGTVSGTNTTTTPPQVVETNLDLASPQNDLSEATASLPMTRNSSAPMDQAPKDSHNLPSIRFIPHHDPRATRPSLAFQAVSRTLPTQESVIKVGRYSERDAQPGDIPRNTPSSAPVGFKSKVVSRRHCEFWCENSQWFIKDVKSSSGTFLNHLRLSPPGVESRPWPINDGDVVQLGIDFRGGEEMIFRCVKIRIELNRGWQKALNNFNKTTHRKLRKLADPKPKRDSDTASLSSSECAICLMSVAPCQSLFVAPCSHVWHYKCIRPILNGSNYPQFLCPNCRAVADLEAEVEEQESDWEEDLKEAIEQSKQSPAIAPTTLDPKIMEEPQHEVDDEGDSLMADAINPAPGRPAPPPPAVEPVSAPIAATAGAESNLNGIPAVTTSPPPPPPPPNGSVMSAARPIPNRNPSPGTRRYDLLSNGNGVPTEGPMTPRNDAGPFVLDGGAGQAEAVPPLTRQRSESHLSLTHHASHDHEEV
ncbi:SMAD/FHA domain-containing protein [Microthyrium microscopicum]|uniref:SMAD/FHA domain-containing protein n=1 Tax=Microthyrium microscopicum TaxID=703497 RepID=A0A6A6U402_9PEZI|nr:SMAD/FHA domain-containing protein [Microthyrium microscopicum]